ncbi:MAG: tRNA 2-thiouridine(34) synthase MnmA [Victivallaceae bacterium]
MKIAVGLSGGVDSAVTAALLREAGHEVVGITMKIWRGGKYRGGDRDACFGPGEEEDIRIAAGICRQLDIPFHVFDCADEYQSAVLEYFRAEYLAGRTPNPCVRCNALMKFGVLPDLARRSGLDFERFATGHYARIAETNDGAGLFAGADPAKDQSYFLYRLPKRQLENLLFPLGTMCKSDVRAAAAKFGLAVCDKPDSQDFYSGDHTELLATPDRRGNIVDTAGNVLGVHAGFWHYTIGQRKGLGIAAKHPLYVIELDACRNQVVVGPVESTRRHRLTAVSCNYLAPIPAAGTQVGLKIRSAGKPLRATILRASEDGFQIEAGESLFAPARGQSAVLYGAAGRVLGGGLIDGVDG